jgi:hypothetical protein
MGCGFIRNPRTWLFKRQLWCVFFTRALHTLSEDARLFSAQYNVQLFECFFFFFESFRRDEIHSTLDVCRQERGGFDTMAEQAEQQEQDRGTTWSSCLRNAEVANVPKADAA